MHKFKQNSDRDRRKEGRDGQASLILTQVLHDERSVFLSPLCIFPIKATCNSNELEDINLRAVNPKKPQTDGDEEVRHEINVRLIKRQAKICGCNRACNITHKFSVLSPLW